jgi:dienelactone hydrolase
VPLVVLSHGLGGTREGLAYLGEALAEAGYVAVHLQHPGSDAAIWQGAADMRSAMGSAAMNPGAAMARLGDVVFALDHVLAGEEPSFRGLIDPGRIAAAGHSYGAWTVSHVLGERLPLGRWGLDLPDCRLRAGIELSPIPPLPIPVFGVPAAVVFTGISAPVLHVTGTLDSGMGVPDWRARTVGFRTAASPGLLAVLDGATHASFAGEAGIGGRWNDPAYQPRVARLCRLFLDAVLREDPAARVALLRGDGLGARDILESKGLA